MSELFQTASDRVERLYFDAEMRSSVKAFCDVLARRRRVYRQVGADEMRRVAGTAMHGGVVALARPRPILDLDPAAAGRWAAGWAARGEGLIILDGIGNPQNIGAIARTAVFFGVKRMVLSGHPEQAGLSDAAYRIAKGGLERIEVYRASRLVEILRALSGPYEVVGTAVNGKPMSRLSKFEKPVALVLGNEEDGLSRETLSACSSVVALEGSGHVQSLNVGAVAAILIHRLLARE